MSHIHLLKDDLIDKHNWHGNLDLLNIIMVGLSNNLPPHDDTYEMHRLLSALLSKDLTVNEKLDIIGNEYDIPVENNLREDVNVMCNLGQGIEDRAIAETTAKIILNMYHSGYSLAQIADAVEMTETEVLDIITSASA